MITKSYLIADHPEHGKDQIISDTITYPWNGCKVADDITARNDRIIADALNFAQTNGYDNIREVKRNYTEKYIGAWRMVKTVPTGREKIVSFSRNN